MYPRIPMCVFPVTYNTNVRKSGLSESSILTREKPHATVDSREIRNLILKDSHLMLCEKCGLAPAKMFYVKLSETKSSEAKAN